MGERENRIELANDYLLKSKEKLESAEILLKENKFADSISRSYYAVYLSIKGVLLLIDEEPKTHSGLKMIFGMKFVKTNMVEKKYAKILNELSNARQQGDYNPLTWFNKKDTQKYYADAVDFVERMMQLKKELLKKI
ncbi:MAG: HEPN domain-containing protein [Promethearchaeia archaeon]